MSLAKKAIGGSIHRIREFELEKVNLADEFDILQIVGEGWFGKILLTEHRSTQTEMVLKALPKAYTGITDFYREFHYGLHLAAHRNIITTYDVAFETAGFYIFSQEYAPLGDLTSNVTETGLGELHAKRVARQLAAAVHHIHSRELVHRDIKLDNILVFRSDFSRIKLCDFGETRRANTVVRRHNEWLPYSPPEVLQIDTDEAYKASTCHDVWQFGIVLFVCLTGCIPWQKAAMDDRRYTRYVNWHTATLNIAKKPKLFQLISSRAQRMFRRLLEPKLEKRPVSVLEVNKYLEDRWLAKLGAEKALSGGADERDELSPSMYSFHSSLEEKNQLLYTLTQYGIETTVDRVRKKDRIREWIESSAIAEENEEESDAEVSERLNGSEVEEDSMKGRHFPERHPSARRGSTTSRSDLISQEGGQTSKRVEQQSRDDERTNRKSRKSRRTNAISNDRAAVRTVKQTEQRNPFAPQVARERHTEARFASFPNGDPSLAIPNNRALIATENPLKLPQPEKPEMAVTSAIFTDSGGGPGSLAQQTSGISSSTVRSESMRSSPSSKIADNGEYENSSKPEISRNDRTSPSGARQSPDNRQGRVHEETDLIPRSPQVPTRKHRSQTAPFPTSALNHPNNEHLFQGEAHRSLPTIPLPTNPPLPVSETTLLQAQLASSNGANNNNNNNNPLTMTVASHLVMQSFNALQTMNLTTGKHTSREKQSFAHEELNRVPVYGKDAYEHYGVAHRAVGISRNDTHRQGSSGSASRSVSN